MRYLLRAFTLFFAINLHGQVTVGVLSQTDQVSDGYTFFSPFSGTKAYLIDNCGQLINEWDRGTRPGLSAYFLDDGLMLRTYKADLAGPFTSASNAGGLELVDWDNNTIWKYEINTPEQLSHHDAVMMDNGHILVLTWELTYRDELVALGRDPTQIATENYMWSEKILEIKPIGSDGAEIIWQWHINDHYIQDFDGTLANFGMIEDHPELFDINLPELNSSNSNATRDWNHFNAIDYNEDLDQILLSVRNSDEIWILDHSTTTEEAASHQGGKYGKGGDLIYRWGNASSYQRANVGDQKLFGQHGVHWIDESLNDAGGIMIYNNGNGQPGADYSRVQILNPPQDSAGYYQTDGSAAYGPDLAEDVYGDLSSEQFYSAFLSNAYRLVDGNTLINAGSPGRIFEITPDRQIAWSYEIPLFGDVPATQGQNVNNNGNFRAYKYPSNYAGFDNVDLTPGDPIEIDPIPCEVMVSTIDSHAASERLWYHQTRKSIQIESTASLECAVSIYDVSGAVILTRQLSGSDQYAIDIDLQAGMYVAAMTTDGLPTRMLKFLVY